MSFTLGRGNEIIIACIQSMFPLIRGLSFGEIINDIIGFGNKLSCDAQLRWIGPEKGVLHMACAAYNNAIFDLWSWCYNKPLWKFLVDMPVDQLVKCIDFKYITDVINRDYVKQLFKENQSMSDERIETLNDIGYPLYVTAAGWLGYSDEEVRFLCKKYYNLGRYFLYFSFCLSLHRI